MFFSPLTLEFCYHQQFSFVANFATIRTSFWSQFFLGVLQLMGSDQLLSHFPLISTHEVPDSSSSSSSSSSWWIFNHTEKENW
jgi:hypothetical protein